MKSYYKRYSCRVCQTHDLQLAVAMTATPIGDAYSETKEYSQKDKCYPLDLYLCPVCGMVQLNDVINPELLYADFLYSTKISLGLQEYFDQYAQDVVDKLSLLNTENLLVLDIGSNDGTLLNSFKTRGFKVLGIDPAVKIAKSATARGVETIPACFNKKLAKQLLSSFGKAKIVTSNFAFANMDNLDEVMLGVLEILDEDGCFIIETGYLLSYIEQFLFDNIYHEHLSYFGLRPLKKLLQNYGLKLFDVNTSSEKGGALRIYASRNAHVENVEALENLRRLEKNAKLYDLQTYRIFSNRLEQTKKQLKKTLMSIIAEGKTIAAYGASVGSTTFLYQMDISAYLLEIYDDNKEKQGLYSPGLKLHVFDRAKILRSNPDYILILAWRYAENIIKNNQNYLNTGGRFICPLPELKIVRQNNV